MKDTPRNDEWETYCDECYYHLWRVRRKNERGFNDGYHLNNGNEAKDLVGLLNNLEMQRHKLLEALERILDYQGRFAEEEPESIAREALKSLAPNK